jgi:hypothetical protein
LKQSFGKAAPTRMEKGENFIKLFVVGVVTGCASSAAKLRDCMNSLKT